MSCLYDLLTQYGTAKNRGSHTGDAVRGGRNGDEGSTASLPDSLSGTKFSCRILRVKSLAQGDSRCVLTMRNGRAVSVDAPARRVLKGPAASSTLTRAPRSDDDLLTSVSRSSQSREGIETDARTASDTGGAWTDASRTRSLR